VLDRFLGIEEEYAAFDGDVQITKQPHETCGGFAGKGRGTRQFAVD